MADGVLRHVKRISPTDEGHRDFDRNAALASKIAGYWAARGYQVETQVVNEGFMQVFRCAVHGVRSDMVNGFPVRKLRAAA